jgi:hypothetical protein
VEARNFVIRRSFLIPLGLVLALAIALLVVCLSQGEPPVKVGLLGLIIVPVALLFAESASRRVTLGAETVAVRKLLRRSEMRFAAMTAVETVAVRKRVFLTLCAGDDFLILSNAYADFPGLVRALLERVPPAAVSEETRRMADAPPVKSTDIVTCWLMVALLAFILYSQLTMR